MLVIVVAEMFASRLFRPIVLLSLSNHLLSSLVCWCSAFCHITAACVSGKIHYVIPVPLLFVERCKYQAMRQRHPQPIGGARSGWRRNARALRDDGKKKSTLCFTPSLGHHTRRHPSLSFMRSGTQRFGVRWTETSCGSRASVRRYALRYKTTVTGFWSISLVSSIYAVLSHQSAV